MKNQLVRRVSPGYRALMTSVGLMLIVSITQQSVFGEAQWDGPTKKVKSEFRYFLHTGYTIDAVLKTAIFSFNLDTPVIAEAESDVTFLEKVVLPKGTKFIGTASVVKSVDRVQVVFHTIVTPKGDEIPFHGIALDIFGAAGIKGKVKNVSKAAIPAQVLLASAGSVVGSATGQNIAGEVSQAVANEANSQIAEKQTYSIEVNRDVALGIFISSRVEF